MPRWRSQSAATAAAAERAAPASSASRDEEVVAGGVQLGELRRCVTGSPAIASERGQQRRTGFVGGAEPGDAGIAPEPHALAAGEAPGAAHRGVERGVDGGLRAGEVGRGPPCSRSPGAAVRDSPGAAGERRGPRRRSPAARIAAKRRAIRSRERPRAGSQTPAIGTGNAGAP